MANENTPVSELYTVTRLQIQTHDMSIGNRLLWLINSQTFMLGIYVGTTLFVSADKTMHYKAGVLNEVLPFLALLICVFTLTDVITSLSQINKLIQNYKQYRHDSEQESHYPMVGGTIPDRLLQRISSVCVGGIFTVIWILIILHDHRVI